MPSCVVCASMATLPTLATASPMTCLLPEPCYIRQFSRILDDMVQVDEYGLPVMRLLIGLREAPVVMKPRTRYGLGLASSTPLGFVQHVDHHPITHCKSWLLCLLVMLGLLSMVNTSPRIVPYLGHFSHQTCPIILQVLLIGRQWLRDCRFSWQPGASSVQEEEESKRSYCRWSSQSGPKACACA